MMDEIQKVGDKVPGKPGRPKGSTKAAKEAAEQAARAQQFTRTAPQHIDDAPLPPPSAGRTRRGPVEVRGRNGEVLSRTHKQTGDQFHIPESMIPDGWDYQWIAVTVTGNTDVVRSMNMSMHANGWRPVPAERHAGVLVEIDAKGGTIIRDGQMLVERPKALSIEARAEELGAAHKLISDRNEALKLTGVKNSMAPGFEMGGKYRGTGGDVRISVDQALDAPRPSYKTEE